MPYDSDGYRAGAPRDGACGAGGGQTRDNAGDAPMRPCRVSPSPGLVNAPPALVRSSIQHLRQSSVDVRPAAFQAAGCLFAIGEMQGDQSVQVLHPTPGGLQPWKIPAPTPIAVEHQ